LSMSMFLTNPVVYFISWFPSICHVGYFLSNPDKQITQIWAHSINKQDNLSLKVRYNRVQCKGGRKGSELAYLDQDSRDNCAISACPNYTDTPFWM
jgi:hypothetical protein